MAALSPVSVRGGATKTAADGKRVCHRTEVKFFMKTLVLFRALSVRGRISSTGNGQYVVSNMAVFLCPQLSFCACEFSCLDGTTTPLGRARAYKFRLADLLICE